LWLTDITERTGCAVRLGARHHSWRWRGAIARPRPGRSAMRG
jgi:hypothetical protein